MKRTLGAAMVAALITAIVVPGVASAAPADMTTTTATTAAHDATAASGSFATAKPTFSGTVRVGLSVKVAPGQWTPSPTTLTYQWLADGTTIAGATGPSYNPAATYAGKKLTVLVTGARTGYATATALSDPVTIAEGQFTSPTPKIIGTSQPGNTLYASAGTWYPAATASTYQWWVNGVNRGNGSSLKLTSADRGKKVAVAITGTRIGYAKNTVTSAAATVTGPFGAAYSPTVSGSPMVGSVLTARTANWVPYAYLSYQWRRDGVAIATATGPTYRLTSSDAGRRMSVTASGVRPGYTTTTRTSTATAVVVWPSAVTTPKITKWPASTAVNTGSTATFTVQATGGSLSFQWQASSDGTTWKNVSGGTAATLRLTVTSKNNLTSYRVVVSNPRGSVTTAAAYLVVDSSRTDPYASGAVAVLNNWVMLAGRSYLTSDDYDGLLLAVPVSLKYEGTGSASPWLDLSFDYVARDGSVYENAFSSFDDDVWNSNELYAGGAWSGTAYFAISSSAAAGGVLRVTDTSDWDNQVVQYFVG